MDIEGFGQPARAQANQGLHRHISKSMAYVYIEFYRGSRSDNSLKTCADLDSDLRVSERMHVPFSRNVSFSFQDSNPDPDALDNSSDKMNLRKRYRTRNYRTIVGWALIT